ncbi:hypothetical protein ACFL0D_02780 [Thermoproteota archaeon]
MELRIYTERLEISREGYNLAALTGGLHGMTSFYLRDVIAVHFKRRGLFVGWLSFSLSDMKEPKIYNVVENDYSISFLRDSDQWQQVYEFVLELLSEFKTEEHERARKHPCGIVSRFPETLFSFHGFCTLMIHVGHIFSLAKRYMTVPE